MVEALHYLRQWVPKLLKNHNVTLFLYKYFELILFNERKFCKYEIQINLLVESRLNMNNLAKIIQILKFL